MNEEKEVFQASVNLAGAINTLQLQIVETGREMRVAIDNSLKEVGKSIDNYSESSNKSANAMKWLTFGLFFVSFVQIAITILSLYVSL